MNDEIVPGVMDVIPKHIYLKVRRPEYFVALPTVLRAESMFDPNRLLDRPEPLVVAVYRLVEAGHSEGDLNKYEFAGVEVRQ